MKTRFFGRFGAHAVGTFGLLLVLLVGELVRYDVTPQHTRPQRARAWLARRAMDAIGAIGWIADRLPPQASGTKREPKHAGERAGVRIA